MALKISRTLTACLFMLTAVSCHRPDAHPTPAKTARVGGARPIVQIMTKKGLVTFEVEVARTPSEREKGLMYRESLNANKGMLFLFDEEKDHYFWMKDTLVPLDLIFFDKNWFVIGYLENMRPLATESRSIKKTSRYVLEINAGLIKEKGIDVGDLGVFVDEGKN